MQRGPADKVAKALQEGDFQKAVDAMQELNDKLKSGELTEKEREELAKQLDQMRDKIQETVQAHQDAKEKLREQIEEQKKQGNLAKAGELQRQLDRLNELNEQMNKLGQMAENLSEASESLRNGQSQQASQQLQEMTEQLQEMQSQLDELEMIESAMDEIADAKAAMCEGQDGDLAFGMGMGQGNQGDQPGMGMGEGQGEGDRPEERTDTSNYRSRVAQNVQQGEAIRGGYASGRNLAGNSQEAIKQEILNARPESADPVENVRLPRVERDHSREYFQNFVED
jgi:hypothetical protein